MTDFDWLLVVAWLLATLCMLAAAARWLRLL
jgi:hypothetical protein